MKRFFVREDQIEGNQIYITGSDVNHIRQVLRMHEGDDIWVSDGAKKEYHCVIHEMTPEQVQLDVLYVQEPDYELPGRICLFQGLPKGDKMEFIIQKAVELGAHEIIPVASRRAVVKLDKKKEEAELRRVNAISESAAKQSKRRIIPQIAPVMEFREALSAVSGFDLACIPYECESGMEAVRKFVGQADAGQRIAVFIGPEGGFEEAEVEAAVQAGVVPVSLGKRILRTETAGLCMLSVLAFKLEGGI